MHIYLISSAGTRPTLTLVCRNSAPEPFKALTLLFPHPFPALSGVHGVAAQRRRSRPFPSGSNSRAGSWGATRPLYSVRYLSFWDFSPVSDGDKGTAEPWVCCSTAALWKVCLRGSEVTGVKVILFDASQKSDFP